MRLLSWNIHKGIGGQDRRYSLHRIIDTIESENPDIICLQEVDRHVHRSHFDDQPRLLASYFRCQSMFQSNVQVGNGAYGNLVLSRWPIVSRHRVSLRKGSRKPRGAQLLLIASPEGGVHLIHTHLGLMEKERQWQIERLTGHALFPSLDTLPTLVVGDFNDWRDSLWKQHLSDQGFAQVTHPVRHFKSFPSWLAVGSLDKAFARGPLHIHHARMVKTSLSKVASDHLPLVIDFHVNSCHTKYGAAESGNHGKK
ncbi:MAG: endonuclease/exonuclease/phosphatase family protein [Pirellulales bacterium]